MVRKLHLIQAAAAVVVGAVAVIVATVATATFATDLVAVATVELVELTAFVVPFVNVLTVAFLVVVCAQYLPIVLLASAMMATTVVFSVLAMSALEQQLADVEAVSVLWYYLLCSTSFALFFSLVRWMFG